MANIEAIAEMSSMRDEDLIRDPEIRQAVEAWRANRSQPAAARSRHWPIGWLISALAIGGLAIVLISLIHLSGG